MPAGGPFRRLKLPWHCASQDMPFSGLLAHRSRLGLPVGSCLPILGDRPMLDRRVSLPMPAQSADQTMPAQSAVQTMPAPRDSRLGLLVAQGRKNCL
jgi:hypothetical protein